MYNTLGIYRNPFYGYVHTPMYHVSVDSRNQQGTTEQVCDALLVAIKKEAGGIDFYRRLAKAAPNQNHKNVILYVKEGKKFYLQQFTDLYTSLAGNEPEYQIDPISFQSYKDGLKKACTVESDGYHAYRNSSLLSEHPYVQQVFTWALSAKSEYAARFDVMNDEVPVELKDYGGEPFVVNIDVATTQNNTYRTALWTGEKLQVTLMSINVGDDIGLEVHPTTDQFLRIEQGEGLVQMGDSKDLLDIEEQASDDYAIMIPAGKWHNVTNTGNEPLKIYAIYAPPEHPFGTVHETKEDAMAAEEH
jgi:mannose-6-phosphate isomerase-like protein (cupin superfamily)